MQTPSDFAPEPEADRVRERGLEVAGELYRRSDEELVELAVAWEDQE